MESVHGRADRVRVAVNGEWRGGEGGLPEQMRIDNGAEFTSKRLDQWAYLNGVRIEFSRCGKTTDNGLIEAFNGRLHAECLNENWFLSMEDARLTIEVWGREYNEKRPHGSLDNLAPASSFDQARLAWPDRGRRFSLRLVQNWGRFKTCESEPIVFWRVVIQ